MSQNSNPQNLNTVTFSQIVDNEFDITETYWHPDMGGLVPELVHATQTIDPWIPGLRQIMEQNLKQPGQTVDTPALLGGDEWANLESQWFWDNYVNGNIGAVDGTIIFPHTKFVLTQVFAVGVGVFDILPGVNARGFLTLHRDVPQVVLPSLCVRLESWQCPSPTLFIFLAAFSSRSCSMPQFKH